MKRYSRMPLRAAVLLLCGLTIAACAFPAGALPKISTAVDCLSADTALIKTGLRGQEIAFSESDFKKVLGVSDVGDVTVVTLPDPADGVLRLSGLRVAEGQMIRSEYLSLLRFIPAGEMTDSASFTFTAGDCAGGAAIACTLRMTDAIGHAPTAGDTDGTLSVYTQKSIAVFGKMTASDADGDKLHFEIVSYPKKGILSVTDANSGDFRYTPVAGYTGSDAFTYVARDEYGNYSDVATVRINVDNRKSELVFSDMTDHPAYIAALQAVDSGVLTADTTDDGTRVFVPDVEMTRGEFTVAVMKAAGIEPLGFTETSFEDNAAIPETEVAYIATAQAYGFVHGILTADGLYFSPDKAITRAEAATLIGNVYGMRANDDVLMTFSSLTDIPVYARPAVAACHAAGIPLVGSGENMKSTLTRAEAAEILVTLGNR